jgi:hypothetical protein
MGKGSGPPREGRGVWLVIGAAMLCPASKLVLLLSAGGAVGGLLSNTWFLAGVFAVFMAGVWFAFRLVKRRLAQRGTATVTGEVKEREYTN